jgi:hypothetical protein
LAAPLKRRGQGTLIVWVSRMAGRACPQSCGDIRTVEGVIPSWLTRRTGLTALLGVGAVLATSLDVSGGWKAVSITVLALIAVITVVIDQRDKHDADQAEAARSRLDVQVTLVPSSVQPVADPEDFIAAWETAELRACLRSVQPKPEVSPGTNLSALGGQVAGLQAVMAAAEQHARLANGMLNSMSEPEDRTEDEYRKEVGAYIERATDRMREYVLWREIESRSATFRVAIHNATDRNYAAVEVEVYVPGDVHGFDPDDIDEVRGNIPQRPRAFGTRKPRNLGFGYGSVMPSFPYSSGPIRLGPRIDNSGSMRVTFPPVDLRPGEWLLLDPIHISTISAPGEVLRGTWEATATNADGRATGDLVLTVAESALDVDAVLATWLAGEADHSKD